jgi:hypothetical protein
MSPNQITTAHRKVEERLNEMFEDLYRDGSLTEEQIEEGLRYHDGDLIDSFKEWRTEYEASLR